jgi:hypothetical protein
MDTVRALYHQTRELGMSIVKLSDNQPTRLDGVIKHLLNNKSFWMERPGALRRLQRRFYSEVTLRLKEKRKAITEPLAERLKLIEDDMVFLEKTGKKMSVNDYVDRHCPLLYRDVRSVLFDQRLMPIHENMDALDSHGWLVGFDRVNKTLTITTKFGVLKIKH